MENINNNTKKKFKKRYLLAIALLSIILFAEATRIIGNFPEQTKILEFYVEDNVTDVGEPITFRWNIEGFTKNMSIRIKFGDGTFKTIAGAESKGSYDYCYTSEGLYNATLYVIGYVGNRNEYLWKSVTDSTGKDIMIEIKNEAPKFGIGFSNNNPIEDESVRIFVDKLDDSEPDMEDGAQTFIYDFADGSEQITTTALYIEHSWKTAGKYPVSITAIDNQGAMHQETKNIIVVNSAPEAAFNLGAEIPATYSFSEDIEGTIPFGWKPSDNNYAKRAIKVVDEKGYHGKVLEITSNPELSVRDNYIETYVEPQYYGTIEYHLMTENINDPIGFMALKTIDCEVISIFTDEGIWKYRLNGLPYMIYPLYIKETPENKIWYHIRIDFCIDNSKVKEGDTCYNLKNNQFRISIDGCDFVYNDFNVGINPIIYLRFGSFIDTDGNSYIDSIGLSWDENYKIGDNFNVFKPSYYGTYDWRENIIGEDPHGWEVTDYDDSKDYKLKYLEDFKNTLNYWDLYDVADRNIEYSDEIEDSYVSLYNPDQNYGNQQSITLDARNKYYADSYNIRFGYYAGGVIPGSGSGSLNIKSQDAEPDIQNPDHQITDVNLNFNDNFQPKATYYITITFGLKFYLNPSIPSSTRRFGMCSANWGVSYFHTNFDVTQTEMWWTTGGYFTNINSISLRMDNECNEIFSKAGEYYIMTISKLEITKISLDNLVYIKKAIPYLTHNNTQDSTLNVYLTNNPTSFNLRSYSTSNFYEDLITWNNKPALISNLKDNIISGTGYKSIKIGKPVPYYGISPILGYGDLFTFYTSEYTSDLSKRPVINHYLAKNFQGNGFLYCQTDRQEQLTLRSPKNLDFFLQPGDKIEIRYNTTSKNKIDFNLLYSGIIEKNFLLNQAGNTDLNSKIVQFIIIKEMYINQLEFNGIFEDRGNLIIDYIKIYEAENSDVSIVSVEGNYGKVVQFFDKSTNNNISIDNFFENQYKGIIEFWVKSDNPTVGTWTMSLCDKNNLVFQILMENDKWKYSIDGVNLSDIIGCAYPIIDKWYHIQIDFDHVISQIKIKINEIESDPIGIVSFNTINKLQFSSKTIAEGFAWIDAIGYSWDELYEIGDNQISMVTYPEKTNIQFNAADSYDTLSDRDSLKYYWNFGDGASGFGKYVSHDYLTSGKYNVTLYCKDDNGAIDKFSQIIRIYNIYPKINLTTGTQNIIVNEGDTVLFNSQSWDEITDFAKLTHWWIFNDSKFSITDLSAFEYGGWRKSHIYTDDYDGKAGVLLKDTEGAYDYDLINILVKNVNPLISIYEASVLANISFEVKRSSLTKSANFTCNLMMDDLFFLTKDLIFNNSEDLISSNEKELVAMSLSKNWKVTINSTNLPENSWFELYINLEFLDGKKVTINSGKFFGGNSVNLSVDLDPLWIDAENYSFKHPITLQSTIWDPSTDDINLNVDYEVGLIVEIDCANETQSSHSITLEQELNNAFYDINLFQTDGRKFVRILATQSIFSKSYNNNKFPIQIDFSFDIFPIIDLNRILVNELNLVNLSILDYINVENKIVANVSDDDGGSNLLEITFDTYYGIKFENLSPGLEICVPNNRSLETEINFYADVTNFDQIIPKNDYIPITFSNDYVPIIPDDFTLVNGTIEKIDSDLYFNDNDYVIFSAGGEPYLKTVFFDDFNDGIRNGNWTDDKNFGCIQEENDVLQLNANWLSYWGDFWCWTIDWAPYCKVPLSLYSEDDWEVTLNVSEAFDYPNRHHYGIMLYQNDENVWLFGPKSGGYIQLDKIVNGNLQSITSISSIDQYLRISRRNNTYYFDYSGDKELWSNLYSTTDLGIIPSDTGVFHKAWLTWSQWVSFDDFCMKEFTHSSYTLNFTTKLQVNYPDNDFVLKDLNFLANYKTDSEQLVNISIYNFKTNSWTLIDSNIINANNHRLNLTILSAEFLNENNELLIKLEAANDTTPFKLLIDQLKIEYSFYQPLIYGPFENTEVNEFPNDFNINEGIIQSVGDLELEDENYVSMINSIEKTIDLDTTYVLSGISLYDTVESVLSLTFRTNISAILDIYLYNYILEQWILVDSTTNTEDFNTFTWLIKSFEYLGQYSDLKVKLKLSGSSDFQFDLDVLKINYSWTKGDFKKDPDEYKGEYFPNDPSSDININSGTLNVQGDTQFKDNNFFVFNSSINEFNTIDLTCAFFIDANFGDNLDYVNLMLSFRTNNNQLTKISVFNYSSVQWIQIDNLVQKEFNALVYSLPLSFEDFYDSNILLVTFLCVNETSPFQLSLDQLKINYKYIPSHLLSTNAREIWAIYGNTSQIQDFEHIYYFSDKYDYLYWGNYSFVYEGDYLTTITADDGFSSSKKSQVVSAFNSESYVRIKSFSNVSYEDKIVQLSSDMQSFGRFENDSRFIWDFGDGYYAYEQDTIHAWSTSGVYNITLKVIDCFGHVYSAVEKITVKEQFPEILGPFSFYGVQGQAVVLDLEIYDSIFDEMNLMYEWYTTTSDLIDGDIPFSTDKKPITVLTTGNYTYSIVVTDIDGNSASANITIFVEDLPPIVSVSNYMYLGNGEKDSNLIKINAYAYDSFLEGNKFTYTWTITNELGRFNHVVRENRGRMDILYFECEDTVVYIGEVIITDEFGKSAITSFTINSFIDSNGNLFSDEFEEELAINGIELDWYTDTDQDGYVDVLEMALKLNETNPDIDNDGLLDGFNLTTGIGEMTYSTDPEDPDSDDDALLDGFEVFGWNITVDNFNVIVSSNPVLYDTDEDGLNDYEEYILRLDPRSPDTDNDGLLDAFDPYPLNYDYDNDGLNDYEEIKIGTELNNTDTDKDSLTDGYEIKGGHFLTNPLSQDTDHDFLSDNAEYKTYTVDTKYLNDGTYIGKKRVELKESVHLKFEEPIVNASSAQISFTIAFGEYGSDATQEYGIEQVPDLEMCLKKDNLILFNGTTNSTRYYSKVIDIKSIVETSNNPNYYGKYVIMVNNTNAKCLLEDFKLEITKPLNPTIDDYDGDGIMDGIETQLLVEGWNTIDFKDYSANNNLTVYNSTETYTRNEFNLEIPSIGRIYDANLHLNVESETFLKTYGTISIKLLKNEINCSLNDAILLNAFINLYENDKFSYEFDLDLSTLLENRDISQYYGIYTLTIDVYEYGNVFDNFMLKSYYIETETWVSAAGLKDYKAWITDPAKWSTDKDGLSDKQEIDKGTNPLSEDTDGDGFWDDVDQDPFHNIILEVYFRSGEKDESLRFWQSELKAGFKIEHQGEEIRIWTPNSDDGDFGQKYYIDVDDGRPSVEFTFDLYEMRHIEIRKIIERFQIKTKIKIIDDFLGWIWKTVKKWVEKIYDITIQIPDKRLERWTKNFPVGQSIQYKLRGGNGDLDVDVNSIRLSRSNGIAIYQTNSSFNGHYEKQERVNVIQLEVIDGNNTTPFDLGLNTIVVPTSLFVETILNSKIQNEQLDSTPLSGCEFSSTERDDHRNRNISNENIDFIIIQKGLTQAQAMEILDLLLICIVNETTNETAKIYSTLSTKLNDIKIEQMNVNSDVLKLIPFLGDFQNSEQGEAPAGFWKTLQQNIQEMKRWKDAIVSSAKEAFEETIKKIKEAIEKIVMTILTFIRDLLWLLIRAALLILIYALFVFEILSYGELFLCLTILFLGFGLILGLKTDLQINKMSIWNEQFRCHTEFIIGQKYNKFLNLEIPTIYFILEINNFKYETYCNFFEIGSMIGFEFLEILNQRKINSDEKISKSLNLKAKNSDSYNSAFWDGFSIILGAFSAIESSNVLTVLNINNEILKILSTIAYISGAIGLLLTTYKFFMNFGDKKITISSIGGMTIAVILLFLSNYIIYRFTKLGSGGGGSIQEIKKWILVGILSGIFGNVLSILSTFMSLFGIDIGIAPGLPEMISVISWISSIVVLFLLPNKTDRERIARKWYKSSIIIAVIFIGFLEIYSSL